VARSPYQSEKRRKELARLKKQEEKRQRRFNKRHGEEGQPGDEPPVEGEGAPETAAEGTGAETPPETETGAGTDTPPEAQKEEKGPVTPA